MTPEKENVGRLLTVKKAETPMLIYIKAGSPILIDNYLALTEE